MRFAWRKSKFQRTTKKKHRSQINILIMPHRGQLSPSQLLDLIKSHLKCRQEFFCLYMWHTDSFFKFAEFKGKGTERKTHSHEFTGWLSTAARPGAESKPGQGLCLGCPRGWPGPKPRRPKCRNLNQYCTEGRVGGWDTSIPKENSMVPPMSHFQPSWWTKRAAKDGQRFGVQHTHRGRHNQSSSFSLA